MKNQDIEYLAKIIIFFQTVAMVTTVILGLFYLCLVMLKSQKLFLRFTSKLIFVKRSLLTETDLRLLFKKVKGY